MDLNDFKEINDNHGHHIGDKALRAVAGMLRAAIRPYDICVRYAGDEFIVVLSGCGYEEAEAKRIELQDAIDQLVFEARPGARLPLSISAGAAVFPHDGDSYESLLAKADSRMYGDKSQLKNDPARQLGAAAPPYQMASATRHTSRSVGRTGPCASPPFRRLPRGWARSARVNCWCSAAGHGSGRRHHLGYSSITTPMRSARRACARLQTWPGRDGRGARARRATAVLDRVFAGARRRDGAHRAARVARAEQRQRLLLADVDVGGLIDIEGPLGQFTFPEEPGERRVLFVAGGTGIAPLRSMLDHALRRFHAPLISLLYSARRSDEFAFIDELRGYARGGRIELHQTVTRDENSAWEGGRGRIGRAHFQSVLHEPALNALLRLRAADAGDRIGGDAQRPWRPGDADTD